MKRLEIKGLSKAYGEKKALIDFDLSLRTGEIVGFIGRNGAGKTTLLNCIAGNIHPTSGRITYCNQNIVLYPELRQKFGVLIEPSFLDYLNCHDNLRLLMHTSGIRHHGLIEKKINEVLRIVGLVDYKKKYVKQFSFGMKQRLGFAQTLLEEKELLFLDEPFVGLDINGRNMMKAYLRKLVSERGVSVLFSDHNLDEVHDLCHRVVAIQEGRKIYDGQVPDEVEYEIFVDDIEPELRHYILKTPAVEFSDDGRSLVLGNNCNLNIVLSEVLKHASIKSIRSRENTLERLLKEGVL